jgi:hypothetical protein
VFPIIDKAIANGEMVEKGCVLSVTQFDKTSVKNWLNKLVIY